MVFGIIIVIILIGPIFIAYYYDYKNNPKEFVFSLKNVMAGIFKIGIALVAWSIIDYVYEAIIPLNTNHGVSFNIEREKLGIPKIGSDWEIDDSDQFEITWWNANRNASHFKKVIEYNYLDEKSETDYFTNKSSPGVYVWSTYEFDNHTMSYFTENPNEDIFHLTENGIKLIDDSKNTYKIDKQTYENFLSE